ncbi:MAG TPA: Clp protease N-terminal domain-containing protein, partial [Actinophytocola sp.]|uniref:Clp protease N-terminal domain-containing protein n=1 Tax=Actinophytocola sp. TaxID=1872138 RepID=UPI002DFC0C28|nr:Clp protease N-terminal domain-containing protein [Actinophytocola sp.]
MFERFTDRAQRSVFLAQEEARILKHHYVRPEHILLGLLKEHDGVAADVLLSFGLVLEDVRHEVEEKTGLGTYPGA